MKDKPVILAVDDQPQNIELLEAYLVPQGYEIVKAASGEEALAKAASGPDLILLDVMMPKMSGFEVLKKLRADEKMRLIPVVMVTSLKETEDRVTALEAGCDDFISKPFEKIELVARVKSLLQLSYYRRQLDEKEKFVAVIKEISDGVVILSQDWKIKDINSSALRYLNILEIRDVNFIDIIFKEYTVSISRENFLDLSISHKTFDITREETEKTKPLYLEVNQDILKNPAGEVSSIVLTLRDMTQSRREECVKQDFLGLISHKLRTPLAVINGKIALLRVGLDGSLTEGQKKSINTAFKESFLLIGLVEKLLGFTIIYSEKLALPKETIELKPYLSLVTDPIIRLFQNKKTELNIDCPAGVNLEINKVYLDQIIGNLIENAIKFNDKNAAKISIVVKKIPGRVEISVTDNGPGIPNEEYERIFEKFYQVEKYFTGQVEGVGLGLAIVKKLIEREGGGIRVESKLGQGSTFIFTLPVP